MKEGNREGNLPVGHLIKTQLPRKQGVKVGDGKMQEHKCAICTHTEKSTG